jgi:hypothetical protein
MNRTKKLMTTVTTSLLLTGTVPGPALVSSAFGQTASQPEEKWKTDTAVGDAADQICGWLKDKSVADAKTVDEIRKQFPALGTPMVDNALLRLNYEQTCKRLGDGTKEKPYRYYGHSPSGGGGG